MIRQTVQPVYSPLKSAGAAYFLMLSASISSSHIFLLQTALISRVSFHQNIPPFPDTILQGGYRQQRMAVLPALSPRRSSSPLRIGLLCIVLMRPASGSLSSKRRHLLPRGYIHTHCSPLRLTRTEYTLQAARILACRACHIGPSSGRFLVSGYVSGQHFQTRWHLLQLANGIPNRSTNVSPSSSSISLDDTGCSCPLISRDVSQATP